MKFDFSILYRKNRLCLLWAAVVMMLLTSCGKPAERETGGATPTLEAAQISPTPTLTLAPTSTPTLEPTLTPSPTPNPEPTEIVKMELSQEWFGKEPIKLENDTFVDLDGDGIAEHIEYSNDHAVTVYINGNKMELQGEGEKFYYISEDHYVFEDYAEVISLDGKTLQLVLLDYAEGHSFFVRIYNYCDGELHLLERLSAMTYGIEEIDDERRLVTVGESYFLENCVIERDYEYKDGKIELIPKEFYEYYPAWAVADTIAKQEIILYADKKGTLGITISKDCIVDVIGSDLREWVLIKNMETEEEGWLRMKDSGYAVLSDGEEVYCTDLFEGLCLYGYSIKEEIRVGKN